MWKLNKPTVNQLNEYLALLKDYVIKKVKGCTDNAVQKALGYDNATNTMDESVVISLITKEPHVLDQLNDKLMKDIFGTWSVDELIEYRKDVKSHNTTGTNYKKYKKGITAIEEIFNYKYLITQKDGNSAKIARMKGRNTCTYCNRLYTLTIEVDVANNKVVRSEFDHWFPKTYFPLLALSYYNLIPSCHICNSNAKGADVFNLTDYYHPYAEKDFPKFKFSALYNGQVWETVIVKSPIAKENNTLEAFCLPQIYREHGGLEVADIMNFCVKANDRYLRVLYERILKDFPGRNRSDIYKMLFGSELNESDFLNRPFSKLKHDILEIIGVL